MMTYFPSDLSSLVAAYVGLEHIKKDLLDVTQHGSVLKYVKEQTHEICLAAVQQNRLALRYVKEHTREICLAAVKQTN